MLRTPMTSLPPPVQSVLELFQGPLASVRFADIDGAGLVKLAAEVEAVASEVQDHEGKLADLRQILAQRQEALLTLAQQALSYARVYAENDEPLLEAVNRISLPRPAKPRKAPVKGSAARDATGETSSGPTDEETVSIADISAADADTGVDADVADPGANADAQVDTGAPARSGRAEAPARGRKGRGAAQRAAN
jgi:hypothetical protein